jgi:hypothetical protein
MIAEKKKSNHQLNKSLEQKGLTSADRSNKATLPLTVPRSHSSRLQRIQPRPYDQLQFVDKQPQPFRFGGQSPPDLVHEQDCSIPTQVQCAGPTSSFLARILA